MCPCLSSPCAAAQHSSICFACEAMCRATNKPLLAASVKRHALHTLCGCVCAPCSRLSGAAARQAGVRRGERILQLTFSSGFKGAAAVWRAVRDVRCAHPAWA